MCFLSAENKPAPLLRCLTRLRLPPEALTNGRLTILRLTVVRLTTLRLALRLPYPNVAAALPIVPAIGIVLMHYD